MTNEQKWQTRLDKWEQENAKKRKAHEMITDYYSNKFAAGLLTVNLVFSFGRAMVPQLYFKNPTVGTQIERPGFEDLEQVITAMDNSLMRVTKLKQTIKRMITSAYCYGRGVGKCGFEGVDSGAYPVTDMPIYRLREVVVPNRPWFLSFYPDDFAFDAQVSDFEDSAWNAMRFELSAEQVKQKDKLVASMKDHISDSTDPDQKYSFWEVWDKFTGKFQTYSKDVEAFVDDEQDIKVWPFYTIDFNWTPRNPFPVSDAELILSLQDEYNEIKTQIHEHRRTSVLKIIARRNAFDREAKAMMASGKVGPLVEVDGPPQETVLPFEPKIPTDLFTTANTTMEDVRDTIGFTRNQLGEYSQPRRTAHEAQIVQQAINLRLDERRDAVGDLIASILVSFNDYCFANWDAQEVEKYAGSSAGWEKVPEIQSEYTLNVVPDSTLPVGRQVIQAEAKELYLTLRGDPLIDQIKLRARYLHAFETGSLDLINPMGAEMQPTPDAIQGAQGNLGVTGQGPVAQPGKPRSPATGGSKVTKMPGVQ